MIVCVCVFGEKKDLFEYIYIHYNINYFVYIIYYILYIVYINA